MWRSLLYILIGTGIVLLTSCSKDTPPDDLVAEPVFDVSGTIDRSPFEVSAGEDGMYMFTFVREEPGGIMAYGGRIEKENCHSDCGPALEILLLDTVPYVNQNGESRLWSELAAALFQGSVINDNLRCKMDVQNLSYSHYGGLTETWTFNDGCEVKGDLKGDYHYFPSNGPILAKLELNDNVGNKASIQKSLYFGYDEPDCGLTMKVDASCPDKINLKVHNPHNMQNLSYLWSNLSTDSSICVSVNAGTIPTTYSVTITDNMNRQTRLSTQFKKIGLQLSYLNADFRFQANASAFNMQNAWPRIVIRYRNEDGEWFDSRNVVQDNYCNYFSLKKLEPYKENHQGLATKKANMLFSTKLANDLGQTINLEHFNVNFGFGSRE